MPKSFYALTVNYGPTVVISIHDTQKKAENARLRFVQKHIQNYGTIWSNYLNYWKKYHSIEFPDYPQPSEKLIFEQFLTEHCWLSIDEFELNRPVFFGQVNPDEIYDRDFYLAPETNIQL